MARMGRPWRDHKPPPAGPVWAVIQAHNSYWMLVAAIELGIFDVLEEKGRLGADALAAHLQVSTTHLQHLLDSLVTLGFLEQLHEKYELTETAERYLCSNGAASMAALVRVSPAPLENWINLADTIRTGQVAAPVEDDIAGFYVPLVKATFPTQHHAASRLGLRLGWQRRPALRVLDLGAGCAPWAIAALEQSPGSSAVVNDFKEVIALAEAGIEERGLSSRVEYRPGNFHQIPFESETYDLVVLGHICRTEGPQLVPGLIARAVDALRPGGQLLVADYFADNERRLNAFAVQMGMTMLANTAHGCILTHEQMHNWLTACELEAIRMLEPIGFNMVYVASKK